MEGRNYYGKPKNNYTGGYKSGGFDPNKKSHFINIPIIDPTFIKEYSNFCAEIKTKTLNDFYPELLQKPGKLHMTICTLDIGEDQSKVDKVHKILTNMNENMQKAADGKIDFNFEKYDTMGNLNSAKVVYAKMLEDDYYNKLCEIIHIVIESLVNEGIISKSSLADNHITLILLLGNIKSHCI